MPFGCDCTEILPIASCAPYANHGDVTRALEALSQCVLGAVAIATDPVASPAAALAEAFPGGFDPDCTPDALFITRPDGAYFISLDAGTTWMDIGGSAGPASSVQGTNVLNNSAVTLTLGNVVVWDWTADSAVDVAVDDAKPIAGIWQETTLSGNTGTMTIQGLSSIQVDGPLARGDLLFVSSVSGKATATPTPDAEWEPFAYALESIGSAGTILAYVDPRLQHLVSYCEVAKSSNQAFSSATETAITWDTDTSDIPGFHDPVTNNTRLTARWDGLYTIHIQLFSTDVLQLGLKKNGDNNYRYGGPVSNSLGASGANESSALTVTMRLSAGDYVEALARHPSSAQTVTTLSYAFMKLDRRL